MGDGEYDANPVFDAAGAAGYQLWPARAARGGLGAPLPEPVSVAMHRADEDRLRPGVYALRRGIERAFGNLGSFGGGLSPLPAWVCHVERVWLWVSAKLLINAMRIIVHQGLAV